MSFFVLDTCMRHASDVRQRVYACYLLVVQNNGVKPYHMSSVPPSVLLGKHSGLFATKAFRTVGTNRPTKRTVAE